KVLEKVYKLTPLRKNFPVNLVVLVNGEPKQVGLKDMLQEFIKHRLEVILRRSRFFLSKTRERLEIVQGLIIALENIDSIIELLKASKDVQSAKGALEERFNLTSKQAQAILEMRLQRLTSMEREKLLQEEKELTQKAEEYSKLVQSQDERIKLFIEETKELVSMFKAPRRTIIEGKTSEEAGSLSVVIYEHGEVSPLERFDGVEPTVNILEVPYSDGLFMVSDMGRVYWVAGKQALKGSKIALKQSQERIVGAFTRSSAHDRIILASKLGFIKKVPLADFEYKSQGMQIFKLSENDLVVCLLQAQEEKQVVLFTCSGKAVRFLVSEVPPSTIGAKPVLGIKLDSDTICGMRLVEDGDRLLIATKRGLLGIIKASDIPLKQRGQKGVLIKAGGLIDLLPFREGMEIMVVTESGGVFYDRLSEREVKAGKSWSLENDSIRRIVIVR
ncbi:MAG: DNA gyrase subunit A, partial [Aquificaceae bacterium]|nr:DNA gyrase subunit A [Aquificaceae bacterium]